MLGWLAHSKECWFIAVQHKLCEFLPDSLAVSILAQANGIGPTVSPRKERKEKENKIRANVDQRRQ